MSDLGQQLRARGKRLTRQRVRVLEALRVTGHATPEEIRGVVDEDGGDPLSLSTIYRCLDALQELDLVTHTHVDHRVPSYHLTAHSTHIHLVCRGCGSVGEVPIAFGEQLRSEIRAATGFVADLSHSAVHGHCPTCASEASSADPTQTDRNRRNPSPPDPTDEVPR